MRVKSAHTEDTKLARSPLCLLRALCVMLLLLTSSAIAQEATQKPKIICDHAAPPRGMHYVCKSQCDCHLEGRLKNDEDGALPTGSTDVPKVCSYKPAKAGELFVCDSNCKCKPIPKESSAKPADACDLPISVVVPPDYPPIARTNRISGVVFVQTDIDSNGDVREAHSVEGHPMLLQAAEQAVAKWKFNRGCNHVQMLSVHFRVSDDDDLDPPGFVFNPPDDVEVIGRQVVVDGSWSKEPPPASK